MHFSLNSSFLISYTSRHEPGSLGAGPPGNAAGRRSHPRTDARESGLEPAAVVEGALGGVELAQRAGRLKDMATRTLLLKLQARGLIHLPPCRQKASNRMAGRSLPRQNWDSTPVEGEFGDLGPLTVREVSSDTINRVRFAAALAEFHYLGFRGTVGENPQYTVTDGGGWLLACLLFGAAAWKCRARDEFIGWTSEQGQRHLHRIANNTRFLILPFVRVRYLANWILGSVTRRLSAD